MGMSQVKRVLKKDPAFLKFKEVAEYCKTVAEFDNLVKEMENMHQARKSRALYLGKPKLKTLMDASLQGTAFRSRCVEIMINVMKAQRTMEAAIDRIEAHIMASYKDELGVKSQADRKTVIKALLQKEYYRLADYNRIIEMAQALIHDLDQWMWTAKHTLDALNILYTRESILGQKKL